MGAEDLDLKLNKLPADPRAVREKFADITVAPGQGKLQLSKEELEQVRLALGKFSQGLERIQPKINNIRERLESGQTDWTSLAGFASGITRSEFEADIRRLPEKVLSKAEITRLDDFIVNSWRNKEPQGDPIFALEKFQYMVHAIRLRLEAVLRGDTTPEIFPEEEFKKFIGESFDSEVAATDFEQTREDLAGVYWTYKEKESLLSAESIERIRILLDKIKEIIDQANQK